VWRRTPDGRVTDVIPARAGFREDYGDFSFVRDAAGVMYWVDRRSNLVKKRAPGGSPVTMSGRTFPEASWMTVSPAGRVCLVVGLDVHEVAPDGASRVVARGIGERALLQFFVGDRHVVMGLWMDRAANVFAAVYGARVVKRVSASGQVTVFARSPAPWSPTGGVSAPNGDTWILEGSATGARVRRIAADGSNRVY
jgi:hypothetical protein